MPKMMADLIPLHSNQRMIAFRTGAIAGFAVSDFVNSYYPAIEIFETLS